MEVHRFTKVYLAGPIEKERERWGIVDWNIYGADMVDKPPLAQIGDWGAYTRFVVNGRELIYTGPYVGEACDHGCAHRTPHAAFGICGGYYDELGTVAASGIVRSSVVMRDIQGIQEADYILAWIPRPDCYGTIAEIGYAAGIGKPVVLGLKGKHLAKEHWFVARICRGFGAYHSVSDFIGAVLSVPARYPMLRAV